MEGFAGRIERNGDAFTGYVHVDHHIGILQAHTRTAFGTEFVAEIVNDTIFDPVGHIA